MTREALRQLTDDELLEKGTALRKAKRLHALLIGFLGGILLFGFGGWLMSPERRVGFLIPMLFPILMIRHLVGKSKDNRDLEDVLRERGLTRG